jgi:iron complex transport system ATP-binding protein
MILIEAKNLRAGYGEREILHGIDFTLSQGERLCVTGPNGCGKTTLLRVLSGILPYRGSLLVTITDPESKLQGQRVELRTLSRRSLSRETALVTQIAPPPYPFTAEEAVAFGRYARAKPSFLGGLSSKDRRACEEAQGACGVREYAQESLESLSGGQLQRVHLARALAQEPATLLLDEPTNHLDVRYQLELLTLIDRWLHCPLPRGAIGVFHDLNLALSFADTMLVLEAGLTAALGPAKEIARGQELSRVYGLDVPGAMRSLLENW